MLGSLLLSLYLSGLVAFSLVTHPVRYCLLLLFCSLCIRGFSYLVMGFRWYLVLFCIVYIGGVYILFIFISVHNPNTVSSRGLSIVPFLFLFLFFFFAFLVVSPRHNCYLESSHYLCSSLEGVSYCFFCLVLMVSFMIVRVIFSEKDSFFR